MLAACSGISLTAHSFKQQDAKKIIDLNYPEVSGLLPEAQQEVNARIGATIDSVKADFERNVTAIDRTDKSPVAASTLTMTYGVTFRSQKFLSIWFDVVMRLKGSPRTNEYRMPFNYDIANRATISLPDIFSDTGAALTEISSRAASELIDRSKSQKALVANEEGWIKTGTAPSFDNFRSFTFDGRSLVIWFPPFQVGPGGQSEEVRIPLDAVSKYLNDYGKKLLM